MMFDSYQKDVINILESSNIDDLSIELSDGSIYELEAKFTSYSYDKNKIISSVPYHHYTRLIEILDKDLNYTKKIVKSDVVLYDNDIRKITIDKIDEQEIIYQQKTRISNIDLKDYNIRISLNTEKYYQLESSQVRTSREKGVTRGRIRRSYISKDLPIQIDITEVTEELDIVGLNKRININYEVEIEYHGLRSNIKDFFNKIEEIFKLMKGTRNIYTNQIKTKLDREIGFLLKTKPDNNTVLKPDKSDKITARSLVKARNIKYRDLVYGGIVGNSSVRNKNVLVDNTKKGTDYYITFKADGIRKYFIIHESGIWLVYPQEEYNLVIPSSDKTYSTFINSYKNSVFDTELVIPKNNINNIENYVLIFDCLCLLGLTQENKSYSERLKYCQLISNKLSDSIITLEFKEAFLLSEDPKLFFPLIKDLYANRNNLNWKDDGFIFTPNNVIYNPRSQTINFMVRNGKLYVLYKNKEVKFEGNDNKRIIYDDKKLKQLRKNEISYKSIEFLSNLNNVVVEYSWTGTKLIPIKKAKNNYGADTEDYALKIWDDITSPDVAPNKLLTNTPDVCKWKHPEDLTIDFLIKFKANKGNNLRRLELYVFDGSDEVIFTGTDRFPLLPENVKTKGPKLSIDESLNNKIIEFEWIKVKDIIMLQPRKYRSDKTNPNQKIVAEDVWEDIMDPIFIQDLVGDTPKLAIKYHNTIKSKLYFDVGKIYKKNFTLLDIGSGRGGDVGKWRKFAGNIIAVEPYKPNRDELIRRIDKNDMNDRVTIVPLGGENTVEITKAVKENIPGEKVDVVTLMLSMSFFWSSDKHLEALVRTIVSNLKPGGRILFFTIDGDSLEELFNKEGVDTMNISGANIHLYPPLGPQWGRPVDFELPGSIIEEGGQREYVVHIQDFTNKLSKYGFVLESEISKAIEPNLLLSEQNLLYTSLYSYGSYINVDPDKLKEFNTNIELPKLPKIDKEILSNDHLEPLEVILVSEGHAINDDTYAPVKCTWFNGKISRIATISGINNFIHSTLKCFYPKYQDDGDARFRVNIVNNIRHSLAMILSYENPTYPGYSYWQSIKNGYYSLMVMKEINDPELIEINGYDHSLQGLTTFLNSDKFLNKDIFELIAEVFQINIYFIRITKEDIKLVSNRIYKNGRKNIVLSETDVNFEPIATEIDGLFQTVFDDNDTFIRALDLKYPEIKSEDKIVNIDENFINDFINIFTRDGVFEFPEGIFEIFKDETDPFRQSLDLLYDNIIEQTNNY